MRHAHLEAKGEGKKNLPVALETPFIIDSYCDIDPDKGSGPQ